MTDGARADGGARHSIGVAADRTGLTVHQLRAWERRHGAVEPERSDGGHRLYTDRDLRRLRLLGELTERDRRIGQLAALSTDALASLLERDRAADGGPPARTDGASEPRRLTAACREAIEAVESFDVDRLESVVSSASLKHDLRTYVDGLVVPVLTEVGRRWHAGGLGIAQEHLASGVFSRSLQHLLEGTASRRGAPGIVVATPSGHRHEIGAMVAAAMAAVEGWRVVFLGADVPAVEIARAAREVEARAVALSLVYGPDGSSPEDELERLRSELPASVAVLVGGRGATGVAADGSGGELTVVDDFGAFGERLRELDGGGSPTTGDREA